jgi:fructose-1,6-bisphosphatase II
MPAKPTPDRNLGMDIVRVTEAAALAAVGWRGRGDKNSADGAAVDAMRLMLDTVPMSGIVVIGEGEKDEAPMLYNGEHVGGATTPEMDVAVDPIDGTRLLSRGEPNSLSVIGIAERGTMFNPGPCVYMDKIATGPESADAIDIEAPIEENIKNVAAAKGIDPTDVTVIMLDRPRHEHLVKAVGEAGARLRMISDGDVAGAIMTSLGETGVDLLIGIGGTPEGVIAACALKCLGGAIQGKLYPRNDDERNAAIEQGYDLDRVLGTDDLVSGDDVFFAATGITDGTLLQGVRYIRGGATSESLVMRYRSGTIRRIRSQHRWEKLGKISKITYHP